jgi:ComF family protein
MLNSFSGQIFQDFIYLFFPRHCLACGDSLVRGEEAICTHCMLEMPQTDYHKDPGNPLQKRISYRIPVKYAIALYKFSKSGRVQNLLHQLKYKNHPEIGTVLGRVYADKMIETGLNHAFEVIIPVPLHPSRRRKRGYNQSAKFAEGLSEKLNIPFNDDLVFRRLSTETQTRKTKLNRWENMSGIFDISAPEAVQGKKILLVDDVVTTGSTLEACGQTLLDQGCSELSIACIAEA